MTKLATFLDVQPLQIQLWMAYEYGQSYPSYQAASDKLNEHNQPYSLGEDEPMNMAENAQSITDSNLQLKQQDSHQTAQHNCFSVVASSENHDKNKVLQSLEKPGVNTFKAKQLIETYGHKRVKEVIEHTIARKSSRLCHSSIERPVDNLL